jgi:hypothetical protein
MWVTKREYSNVVLSPVEKLLQGQLNEKWKDISEFCNHITRDSSEQVSKVLSFPVSKTWSSRMKHQMDNTKNKVVKLF